MPRRRVLQFSLRAFLIAVAVFAAWLGWHLEQARKRGLAIDAIVEAGGTVSYGEDSPVVLFSANRPMSHYWEDVRGIPVDVRLLGVTYEAAISSRVREMRKIHRLELYDFDFQELNELRGVCDILVLHDPYDGFSYATAEKLHDQLPGTTIIWRSGR